MPRASSYSRKSETAKAALELRDCLGLKLADGLYTHLLQAGLGDVADSRYTPDR